MPISEVFNECNMIGMARYPDKYFDVAIDDPPWGIGEDGGKNRRGKSKHIKKKWDNKPPGIEYFKELFRVSKNQIIWGGNYFPQFLTPSMGWICWDKKLDNSDFSDFELAYTSFHRAAKIFRYSKNGGSRLPHALADIIHPCQKPVKLYRWILSNYAKPGYKILDPHMGSQSSRIAAYEMEMDYYGWENDRDYFNDGNNRFNNHTKQLKLL